MVVGIETVTLVGVVVTVTGTVVTVWAMATSATNTAPKPITIFFNVIS